MFTNFFLYNLAMNNINYNVNAAETINAASMFEGFAKYLNEVVYRGYCVGTFQDYLGNDITIVFRCEYLGIKVLPYWYASFDKYDIVKTKGVFCNYYDEFDYSYDEISVSLFKEEKLREIVDEYIPCRAEAMDYAEDEEEQENSFGCPYYATVEGKNYIFHLEDDYGDCAVIENR